MKYNSSYRNTSDEGEDQDPVMEDSTPINRPTSNGTVAGNTLPTPAHTVQLPQSPQHTAGERPRGSETAMNGQQTLLDSWYALSESGDVSPVDDEKPALDSQPHNPEPAREIPTERMKQVKEQCSQLVSRFLQSPASAFRVYGQIRARAEPLEVSATPRHFPPSHTNEPVCQDARRKIMSANSTPMQNGHSLQDLAKPFPRHIRCPTPPQSSQNTFHAPAEAAQSPKVHIESSVCAKLEQTPEKKVKTARALTFSKRSGLKQRLKQQSAEPSNSDFLQEFQLKVSFSTEERATGSADAATAVGKSEDSRVIITPPKVEQIRKEIANIWQPVKSIDRQGVQISQSCARLVEPLARPDVKYSKKQMMERRRELLIHQEQRFAASSKGSRICLTELDQSHQDLVHQLQSALSVRQKTTRYTSNYGRGAARHAGHTSAQCFTHLLPRTELFPRKRVISNEHLHDHTNHHLHDVSASSAQDLELRMHMGTDFSDMNEEPETADQLARRMLTMQRLGHLTDDPKLMYQAVAGYSQREDLLEAEKYADQRTQAKDGLLSPTTVHPKSGRGGHHRVGKRGRDGISRFGNGPDSRKIERLRVKEILTPEYNKLPNQTLHQTSPTLPITASGIYSPVTTPATHITTNPMPRDTSFSEITKDRSSRLRDTSLYKNNHSVPRDDERRRVFAFVDANKDKEKESKTTLNGEKQRLQRLGPANSLPAYNPRRPHRSGDSVGSSSSVHGDGSKKLENSPFSLKFSSTMSLQQREFYLRGRHRLDLDQTCSYLRPQFPAVSSNSKHNPDSTDASSSGIIKSRLPTSGVSLPKKRHPELSSSSEEEDVTPPAAPPQKAKSRTRTPDNHKQRSRSTSKQKPARKKVKPPSSSSSSSSSSEAGSSSSSESEEETPVKQRGRSRRRKKESSTSSSSDSSSSGSDEESSTSKPPPKQKRRVSQSASTSTGRAAGRKQKSEKVARGQQMAEAIQRSRSKSTGKPKKKSQNKIDRLRAQMERGNKRGAVAKKKSTAKSPSRAASAKRDRPPSVASSTGTGEWQAKLKRSRHNSGASSTKTGASGSIVLKFNKR